MAELNCLKKSLMEEINSRIHTNGAKIGDATGTQIFKRQPYHLRRNDDDEYELDHPAVKWNSLYSKMVKNISKKDRESIELFKYTSDHILNYQGNQYSDFILFKEAPQWFAFFAVAILAALQVAAGILLCSIGLEFLGEALIGEGIGDFIFLG